MLPEIVHPLFKLRLLVTDIREPKHIKDAQKTKKSLVKKKINN
jgi:hypothetical protein